MFEKNMRYAFLLDAYGAVLDDHSKNIMTAYYEDDLSLAEIAEGENISRQGVRHIIKKSEEELDFLEAKLGLAEHYSNIEESCRALLTIAEELKDSDLQNSTDYAGRIKELIKAIKQ